MPAHWFPGLNILRQYQPGWLAHDLAAGAVLTTMLIPVGIAYAVAAGLPGIYGLYATIIPLLAYAVFGPSRILVLGPDSSLTAVILGVVLPLSDGNPARAVALAGMLAVVSGLVCILSGIARLGFVTELLSKPIRYGYMNGIALTVLISQLPKLFGFKIEAGGPLMSLWSLGRGIWEGRMNWATFAVGAGTLITILLLKRAKRVPVVLIAVIGATAVVAALDLSESAGVAVLGPLPQGLPGFAIPWIAASDIMPVLIGASRWRWYHSPIPAYFRASTRPAQASRSIPTRKWWDSERPTWRPVFFRAFQSAPAPHAHLSLKPPAPKRS